MKKAVFGFTVMGLLMITSCTKTSPTSNGTWTFKSVTYQALVYGSTYNDVNVSSQTSQNTNTYGTLVCTFYHVLPTADSTFLVAGTVYPDSGTKVSLSLTINGSTGTTYNSTGGNGAQAISATVSSTGLLHLSGSGIEMMNTADHSDSSALTFSISQPQN